MRLSKRNVSKSVAFWQESNRSLTYFITHSSPRTDGVVHLSTGDILRSAVAAGTDVGKVTKDFIDAGKLVPDDVIIGAVKDRLQESDCVESGWLLGGFPRTPTQAEALVDSGVSAHCFIFLDVPDDVLVDRVVGRRTDPKTGKIYHIFSTRG